MEIREIGLEKEVFLLKDGKIMEPKLYGFPYDEMGFLIELRSLPSDRAYPVITTLYNEQLQYQLRANKFNMELAEHSYKYENGRFVKHIEDTYKIREFPDYTQNIYCKHGVDGPEMRQSHHLGVFQIDNPNSDMYKLTAGIHVHFSSRDSITGEVIELPINTIVKEMDNSFKDEIEKSLRIKGEWEPKAHGFEYRSLPCDVDIIKVVKESFKILREV